MSSKEETGETTTPTEDIITRNVGEIIAENTQLTERVVELEEKLERVTTRLGVAETMLESQAKGPKIARIQKISNLSKNDLIEMSLTDLDKIEKIYAHAKTPTWESSADLGGSADPYYNLHNMFKFGSKEG